VGLAGCIGCIDGLISAVLEGGAVKAASGGDAGKAGVVAAAGDSIGLIDSVEAMSISSTGTGELCA